MEELSPIKETIPSLEAGGQASDFSVVPHSLTRNLKSGGVSKPNDVVSDRRRPSPSTMEEMKVLPKRSDKREDVEKIRSSSGTRPWSGTCARIKVIDTPKGTKDRCKKLREKRWHGIRFSLGHLT